MERKFGFGSIVDVLRAAQREALFRLERDRQGVLRVFPGANLLQRPQAASMDAELDAEAAVRVAVARAAEMREGYGPMAESLAEAEEPVLTGNNTPFEGAEVVAAIEKESRPKEIITEIIQGGKTDFDKIFLEFKKKAGVYGYGDAQVKTICYELLV